MFIVGGWLTLDKKRQDGDGQLIEQYFTFLHAGAASQQEHFKALTYMSLN